MRIGSSELQKSVQKAIKAIKGSGGDGNLSAVRQKIRALSALRGAGYRKAIGDAPERVRGKRGKRGKGPAGGKCAP